ncbi:MAG: glycosyl hydrolase family 18 protein, partial [Patescibacteria group bacterium]|nr:glycosyl hydrolase family 18 protein [Patescibacteria group bacterium]
KVFLTVFWYGAEGQDLKTIGKIADEIRIMAYDEHSSGSNSGAISSFDWIKDIASHNLTLIEKDKIVIGIPTYGYVWTKDDSQGLQFYEFNKYLQKKQYEEKRDSGSGERIIKGQDFVAWLSDSQAMAAKINLLRSLGFNRFIFWHLGGMDEKLFDESWQK